MPLPKWATEKSKVKVVETPEDRKYKQRVESAIKKEEKDPELASGVRSPVYADGAGELLKIAELEYEGNLLDYHGYKFY